MHEQLLLARNAYAYPFACLDSDLDHKELDSVIELDSYHYQLLRSDQDREVLNGYLSVLYWGFYSGQDGKLRGPRAKGLVNKAMRKLSETNAPEVFVADLVRGATEFIDSRRPGLAVLLLTNLPQMQFSFASKVAAFLNPVLCGVSDSIIASGFPGFGFVAKDNSVEARLDVSPAYDRYCAFLERIAGQVNDLGSDFQWTDRDSSRHQWRAIDVERALFKSLEGGYASLCEQVSERISLIT